MKENNQKQQNGNINDFLNGIDLLSDAKQNTEQEASENEERNLRRGGGGRSGGKGGKIKIGGNGFTGQKTRPRPLFRPFYSRRGTRCNDISDSEDSIDNIGVNNTSSDDLGNNCEYKINAAGYGAISGIAVLALACCALPFVVNKIRNSSRSTDRSSEFQSDLEMQNTNNARVMDSASNMETQLPVNYAQTGLQAPQQYRPEEGGSSFQQRFGRPEPDEGITSFGSTNPVSQLPVNYSQTVFRSPQPQRSDDGVNSFQQRTAGRFEGGAFIPAR